MAGLRLSPDAGAVADPDRARPQDAAQLAAYRQVKPVMRVQRKVLVIPGEHARAVPMRAAEPVAMTGVRYGGGAVAWGREPVIGIRPGGHLLRIVPRRIDPCREVG
jgi:hypothetical protein